VVRLTLRRIPNLMPFPSVLLVMEKQEIHKNYLALGMSACVNRARARVCVFVCENIVTHGTMNIGCKLQ